MACQNCKPITASRPDEKTLERYIKPVLKCPDCGWTIAQRDDTDRMAHAYWCSMCKVVWRKYKVSQPVETRSNP